LAVKDRCYNPKHPEFRLYGAIGVGMCERWNDFANFLADMGKRPPDKSVLDRYDLSDDFMSGNCMWSTRKEQARNRRNA
jgi:hypothetical protein